VHKRIGPAWTTRGRPAAGYYMKRTAETWLSDVLDQARRGTLPGMVQTGATFADAAAEYVRWIEHDRAPKPDRSSAGPTRAARWRAPYDPLPARASR
jgi:integrase